VAAGMTAELTPGNWRLYAFIRLLVTGVGLAGAALVPAIAIPFKGSAGANYFVWSYKLLDGKGYQCQTTGSQPKAAETALAICRSLSK
jgi:hypothetical protein